MVLFIEIDQRKVDVNVHPTKQVVRFSDDTGVRRAVADAVSLAIGSIKESGKQGGQQGGQQATTPDRQDQPHIEPDGDRREHRDQASPSAPSSDRPANTSSKSSQGRFSELDSQRGIRRDKQERENAKRIEEFQRRVSDASEPLRGNQGNQARSGVDRDTGEVAPESTPARQDLPERGALPELASSRVIGQFGLGYILVEEPGSLWVVDQHVAHERVLLDRLNAGEAVSVQQLLNPEIVELSDTEAAEGRDLLEELAVYGFEAEPFGPASFRITGVISTLADRDIAEAFRDALSVARGTNEGPHREQNILATVACKSAVKLGDRLSHEEMESLMKQWLSESEKPATCPHGRSICYRIEGKEIARKLDRH